MSDAMKGTPAKSDPLVMVEDLTHQTDRAADPAELCALTWACERYMTLASNAMVAVAQEMWTQRGEHDETDAEGHG